MSEMFIDIAFNADDAKYKDNLDEVMQRSKRAGVIPIFIGTDYEKSKKIIELAKKYKTMCHVGHHPTTNTKYLCFKELLKEKEVISVGECGLDYDRLQFCGLEEQKCKFLRQIEIENYPFFFHSRNAHSDFIEIVKNRGVKGVVHSFTGTLVEAKELLDLGLYLGFNGCSLRTEEGMEIVKNVPVERILLETDAPYCSLKPSGPAYHMKKTFYENEKKLKRINEPMAVKWIAEVISGIKNIPMEEFEPIIFENTINCFGEKMRKAVNDFFH